MIKGCPSLSAADQSDVDFNVVHLLSYLAHVGTGQPHESIIAALPVWKMMYKIILKRPTYAEMHRQDPTLMSDEHIAASRFFYGLSLSEDGRSNFLHHKDAVEKMVDLAADESSALQKNDAEQQDNVFMPHEALCYDTGYIIHGLTNFSNKPACWSCDKTMVFLQTSERAMGMQCQFARGRQTWSVSFHVFLLEDFNEEVDWAKKHLPSACMACLQRIHR
jgi:hypothetical protein